MPAHPTTRRIVILLLIVAVLAGWGWWATRSKPIPIAVTAVEKARWKRPWPTPVLDGQGLSARQAVTECGRTDRQPAGTGG